LGGDRAGQGSHHAAYCRDHWEAGLFDDEFTVNGSKFPVGDFINALVSFLLIGAAVFLFIVLPVNSLLARMRRGEAAPGTFSFCALASKRWVPGATYNVGL
jgi:large-conductance mechanosensitive channel